MDQNKFKDSLLMAREIYWDNYFAHRLIGSIGLMECIIAKQAVVLRKMKLDFIPHTSEEEIAFIAKCVSEYKGPLFVKECEEISYEDEMYGNDFSLSEIKELIEERGERKLEFQENFEKFFKKKGQ